MSGAGIQNNDSILCLSFARLLMLMSLRTLTAIFLAAVLIIQTVAVGSAFETDQYNLPPEPLADIGDEVSNYVEESLSKAIFRLNAEIAVRQSCLENAESKKTKCGSAHKELERLNYLRSERAVAAEVYNLLGTGVPPFTSSENWLKSHDFKKQPARYRTSLWQSIYLTLPIDYVGLAPTVNLYGAQFGTDKIAHFFQQGYSYYKIYNDALKDGMTPAEASAKAVIWGQKTERTYYGTLLTGVYSNADLCANYAGMRFYQGLTRAIQIGASVRPPVIVLKEGRWEFNENVDLRGVLLKPFMSSHLNEALNPSVFTKHLGLRASVRRNVKKQGCRQWRKQYPDVSRADFEELTRRLTRWHGEDYGFTDSKNFITIADTCFDRDDPIAHADE